MKILKEGLINAKKESNQRKYYIALLDNSYIDEALKLQEVVMSSLPSEEIYKRDTKEFIEECLKDEGLLLGVFTEDKLISYRFVNFPGNEVRNFGKDLDLSNEELIKVAHFESVLVHPDYVGNRLQRITFELAENIVKEKGYYHICSLISPKNYYSLNNILRMGLNIRGLQRKYSSGYGGEGKYRCILHRDVRKEVDKEFNDIITIISTEIEKQRELINSGYVGYKVEGNPSEFNILYGK